MAQVREAPTDQWPGHYEAQHSAYMSKVSDFGGQPVVLSRYAGVDGLLPLLDGLVVSGGLDVEPSFYGGVVSASSTPFDPVRDLFEIALIKEAVARGLPILGICRGAQIINVALGGTLVADLPHGEGCSHGFVGHAPDFRRHSVLMESGTLAEEIFGESIMVNSYHHQAVDSLGEGLICSGRAPDSVTEVIEGINHDILGIQWHPEHLTESEGEWAWLVEAAGSHATSKVTV